MGKQKVKTLIGRLKIQKLLYPVHAVAFGIVIDIHCVKKDNPGKGVVLTHRSDHKVWPWGLSSVWKLWENKEF